MVYEKLGEVAKILSVNYTNRIKNAKRLDLNDGLWYNT